MFLYPDFLTIDDIDSSRKMLEVATDALTLQRVDAICASRREHRQKCSRLHCNEIATIGIRHFNGSLVCVEGSLTQQFDTAIEHLFRVRSTPHLVADHSGEIRTVLKHFTHIRYV